MTLKNWDLTKIRRDRRNQALRFKRDIENYQAKSKAHVESLKYLKFTSQELALIKELVRFVKVRNLHEEFGFSYDQMFIACDPILNKIYNNQELLRLNPDESFEIMKADLEEQIKPKSSEYLENLKKFSETKLELKSEYPRVVKEVSLIDKLKSMSKSERKLHWDSLSKESK